MNHFTDIRTVGVPVTDQDRAVAFYTGTLGFELLMDAPLPQFGGRWIVVAPAGAATNIALIPASEGNPAGVDTGIRLVTPDAPQRTSTSVGRSRHRRTDQLAGRPADVQLPRPGRQHAYVVQE